MTIHKDDMNGVLFPSSLSTSHSVIMSIIQLLDTMNLANPYQGVITKTEPEFALHYGTIGISIEDSFFALCQNLQRLASFKAQCEPHVIL